MARDTESGREVMVPFGGVLFVPAGLFLGLGLGLLLNKVVEITLLGVGLGFLGYGLSAMLKKD